MRIYSSELDTTASGSSAAADSACSSGCKQLVLEASSARCQACGRLVPVGIAWKALIAAGLAAGMSKEELLLFFEERLGAHV